MFIKTFKKSIALFVALVFVLSMVPFGVMAEVPTTASVVIPVDNAGTCSIGNPDSPSSLADQGSGKRVAVARNVSSASKRQHSYGQFNLTGYEEILENESTNVTYSVRLGGDYAVTCVNLKIQLYNDVSDYKDTSITFNQAKALGLNGTGAMTIFNKNDGVAVDDVTSSAEVDRAGLVSVLRSGTDNSIVCYSASSTTSGPVYYRPTWEGTGLTIEYNPDDIDDEAYLTKTVGEFSWANISAEDINAVENDLTLPSFYRGATVTWTTTDASVVGSDGTITLGKTSKSADLTATFTYKGIASEEAVTATKTFTVTPASEATLSATVKPINQKHSRSKNKNSVSNPTDQSGTKVLELSKGGGDNDRYAYGQYDLTGYEEILGNPSTKVTYSVTAGVGYSANNAYDFKVKLYNDESDYDPETLTYSTAATLGLHGDGVYTMFERADNTAERGYTSSAEVDVQALNSALRSGPTNSVVTWAASTTSSSSTHISPNTGNLTITYYESEIDNEAYANDLEEEFDWAILTDDPQTALVNDLPTYFRGANVTWSANVDGVVSADGKVTQYIERENKLELTATVEFKGYSFTKTFEVTIPEEELKSVVIPLHSGTYISGSAPSKPQGGYNNAATGTSFYSRYMYPVGLYGDGNDRLTFLKWDFAGNLDKLYAARSMSMNIKSVSNYTQDGGNSKLSVLPDGYEGWTETDLTYDIAVDNGIYTDPALYTQTIPMLTPVCEITSSGEFLNAIRKSIADNPDDSVVNFRWEATAQSVTAYRLSSNNKDNFTITLYYYESELPAAYADSKVADMPWSYVSGQPIDSVIADLTLPASFYGEEVTWASSDETVITSSGEVVASDADVQVILTATVNDLTKDFTVTVPADVDYIIKSEKSNYANAFVWAKEASANTTLVVATYLDGELVSVDVRENVALNKGENFVWTKLETAEADQTVKVMLLNNMSDLTPILPAK